ELAQHLARALPGDVLLELHVRVHRRDRTLLADVEAADRHDRDARVDLLGIRAGRLHEGARLLAPAAALADADHERGFVLELALAHLLAEFSFLAHARRLTQPYPRPLARARPGRGGLSDQSGPLLETASA